jgi:hypothetical protein
MPPCDAKDLALSASIIAADVCDHDVIPQPELRPTTVPFDVHMRRLEAIGRAEDELEAGFPV